MINRLPGWFKQEVPGETARKIVRLLSESGVHTVCQEAKCPNLAACFGRKYFTFLILGPACTRNCRFCNVKKAGTALGLDQNEPAAVSRLVGCLGLGYVVLTSVTRDDLEDGGAAAYAKTIELIHRVDKDIKVEALIPDFQGKVFSLRRILAAHPYVVGHNIETVSRLYKDLRPQADYQRSLNVLGKIKQLAPEIYTKSSLMLGLGEKKEEVVTVLSDLRRQSCDLLTLGQYLAPSAKHYPVKEFISVEQFKEYEKIGRALGFKAVLSGPLVRSSYKAQELVKEFSYV